MPYEAADPNDPAYWRRAHPDFDMDAPPPRTNQRLHLEWLLWVVGWSSSELARRLDVLPETARAWLKGRREIPPRVIDWLRGHADYHLAHRLPADWHAPPNQ